MTAAWRLLSGFAVLGALLGPFPLFAQTNWTQPQPPFQIADDVYWVGSAGLGAFLFTSHEGHILIDAPLEENVPLLLANIRALGFDPSDIRIHLTSHAHFDHVGGMAGLLAATGGSLRVSRADAAHLRDGEDFGLDTEGFPAVTPDASVEHLDTVRLGGHALTAHLTPGHTPGCTTWSGTATLEGRSFDFVILCSLSVLSDYRIVGADQTYEGHGADYCRSVDHLKTLEPDIFLSGHAEFFGMEAKLRAREAGDRLAFVERERYPEFIAQAEQAIERALAEQGYTGGCATLLR